MLTEAVVHEPSLTYGHVYIWIDFILYVSGLSPRLYARYLYRAEDVRLRFKYPTGLHTVSNHTRRLPYKFTITAKAGCIHSPARMDSELCFLYTELYHHDDLIQRYPPT